MKHNLIYANVACYSTPEYWLLNQKFFNEQQNPKIRVKNFDDHLQWEMSKSSSNQLLSRLSFLTATFCIGILSGIPVFDAGNEVSDFKNVSVVCAQPHMKRLLCYIDRTWTHKMSKMTFQTWAENNGRTIAVKAYQHARQIHRVPH